MLHPRPYCGIIIWLNFCLLIWFFTVQESVITPADSEPSTTLLQHKINAANSSISNSSINDNTFDAVPTTAPSSYLENILAAGQQGQEKDESDPFERIAKKLEPNDLPGKYSIFRYQIKDKKHRFKAIPTDSSTTKSRYEKSSLKYGATLKVHSTRKHRTHRNKHQLIDLTNFYYKINQLPCGEQVQGLIMVHTAPENYEKRQLIRRTWGGECIRNTTLRLIFLLGADITLQREIRRENALYGDIVQGSFQDCYRNMTYKHVMALQWYYEYCFDAQIMIKVDDDIFVNTPLLLRYASNGVTNITEPESENPKRYDLENFVPSRLFQQPRNLIYCQKFVGSHVKRSYRSKWRVSFGEYSPRFYPPYCPGYAIIYSSDAVSKLYKNAQRLPYFWIDDVHVTGVLAQKSNLSITEFSKYVLFNETLKTQPHNRDISKVEFLFSGHDILPEDIYALWARFKETCTKEKASLPRTKATLVAGTVGPSANATKVQGQTNTSEILMPTSEGHSNDTKLLLKDQR